MRGSVRFFLSFKKQIRQPKLWPSLSVTCDIRDDIKGEPEAVILYEQELAEFSHKDIRTIIHARINEEKGHGEHLTRLLLKFDPDEYDQLS